MTLLPSPTTLLRLALRCNAWFSGLSGLLFLLAARPIAALLGIETPWIVTTLGLGLLLYALWLALTVRRPAPDRREVLVAIGLDAAWVLGSALLLIAAPIPLTQAGKWAVGIAADIVATFAVLQAYGLLKFEATHASYQAKTSHPYH
ncbi:MAG: hypothetical protein AB1411_05765 [Nitrospirota bacterium]